MALTWSDLCEINTVTRLIIQCTWCASRLNFYLGVSHLFDESGLNPSLIKCHSQNTQFLQHGQSSSSLSSTASVQSWVTLVANLSVSFFELDSICNSSSFITELRNTLRLQNRPFSGGLLQPRLKLVAVPYIRPDMESQAPPPFIQPLLSISGIYQHQAETEAVSNLHFRTNAIYYVFTTQVFVHSQCFLKSLHQGWNESLGTSLFLFSFTSHTVRPWSWIECFWCIPIFSSHLTSVLLRLQANTQSVKDYTV